jgi:serine/threonine protein kinase
MPLADSVADPVLLKPHFPMFTGFKFLKKGGYKYVFTVHVTDDGDEVLKIILLPEIPTGLSQVQEDEAKVIREQELGRAKREVSVLRECKSPFVVKLGRLDPTVSAVCGSESLSYSEELLAGTNLVDYIKAGSSPSELEVRSVMQCLLSAISDLWGNHHIVHRDIKPGNVMRTGLKERPFVLLDLGIAYDVNQPGLTVRRDLDPPMTYRYMAPEMADPNFRENLDYRSDLYAAALTVFEFAAGRHPIAESGDDAIKTVSRALHEEPKKLEDLRADLDRGVCRTIDQLLKKKPLLRPASLPRLIEIFGVR